MIIVISNSSREARALALLTQNLPHPAYCFTSIREFKTQLRKTPRALVLTRTHLVDGYSDDILAHLTKSDFLIHTRVIVLANAAHTPRQEARQLSLGADCVLKDPICPEVLLEYISKFLKAAPKSFAQPLLTDHFTLAGATILPERQQLRCGDKAIHITPKEIDLARLLAESPDKIVSYQLLYSELFNRVFSGDSANLRVLLGKLAASYRKLGLDLRAMIQVTPKSGYRYSLS